MVQTVERAIGLRVADRGDFEGVERQRSETSLQADDEIASARAFDNPADRLIKHPASNPAIVKTESTLIF
jgi:hypothetical protein